MEMKAKMEGEGLLGNWKQIVENGSKMWKGEVNVESGRIGSGGNMQILEAKCGKWKKNCGKWKQMIESCKNGKWKQNGRKGP